MAKKHLGTITILVKDRQTNVPAVNKLLTNNGHLIIARLGVNVEPRCLKHCTGMITLAVGGGRKELKTLTQKIDSLYGIVAKFCLVTD